jgi:hypothetical protein
VRKPHATRVLGLALLAVLALPALLAAKGPSVKPQFKKEFLDHYKRLQTDVQFQAAKKSLKGNVLNRPVVDSYLRALPIPPLEMFRLERQIHKIDLAVPDFIESYNERWKELQPEAARRYYGPEGTRRNPSVASIDQLLELEEVTAKKSEAGPNRNVAFNAPYPPVGFQSEVQLVLNPNNPNQIVAASNTAAREPVTCGPRTVQSIYYSNDAGATWGRTCAPAAIDYGLDCAALGGITSGSDPALVWNTNNEVFLNHMMVCFNGGFLYSMVIARSQDAGVTWSPRAVIKNSWSTGDIEDKEFLAIDNHAGSPFFGRLYSCWNHNNNQVIAFSTDAGATWTERDLPAPPQGGIDINCDMAVEKNGTVHLVLETISCSGGDCQNEYLYHIRSTDGGNTWSAPSLVATTNFVSYSSASCPAAQDFRCLGSLGAIDIDNTSGPCGGTVYIAYSDFPTGSNVDNMDILVRRSTNGGATWSAAVKANDDASGRIQFNPFMSVDPVKGQPVLAWVDGRNDPNNLSMDVYAARSVNCGKSFKKNVKVTQPSGEFNNSTISYSNESSAANPLRNGNQYGDYMGIDARNGKAYVAWTDSRHFFPSFQTDPQRENIGFAAVTFGPPAPENLTVTLSNGKPQLSWSYNPPADLAAFNVYRVSNGVYTKIVTIPASLVTSAASRSFTDSTASGQTSSYVVAAVDTEGEEGPYSSPVTVVLANL